MAALISAGGQALSGTLAGATAGLFGKSQVSNRDYQHQQNLLDSGNPREIRRQSAFLEGLAPSQGAAYNTIQDATYAQDTQRQTDRIQTMGDQLGMSPWEITGSPGANPLPSPTGPAPQNNNAQYMGALTQMAASANQSKTQLKIAAMNNDTALRQTQIQADTALATNAATNQTSKENVMVQTANGQVPFSQLSLNAQNLLESQSRVILNGINAKLQAAQTSNVTADTALKGAQTSNVTADTALKGAQTINTRQQTSESQTREIVMKDETIIKALTAIWPYLPKTNITTPLGGVEERTGANDFLKGFGNLQTNSGFAQSAADALNKMDDRQWNSVLDVIKTFAGQ